MSVIRDAALSAFFGKLFEKLTSDDLLKFFQQEKVDADLKRWTTTLMKIHAVLDDAEEKQMTNRLVKIWLGELEDLAYDVDDILDEFATEALGRELNPEPKSKFLKIYDACVGSNRSFGTLMRSKIKEIDTRLQEIVTQKNNLELRENAGLGRTGATRPRVPTTSLVNEGDIHGREEDKKAIVELLLSGESSNAQLSVIPILGMGGMGKTTLAQLVYNDNEVSHHFEEKAWGCVAEDFDIVRVTREILQSVTFESCNDNNLDLLQVKLKGKLSGKKFLLILDDVWNENYNDWTRLRCPFEFGAPGSKIIITTQNDRVSSTMGTTQAYQLKELSNEACLIVFIQNTLGTTNFSAYPELQEFGPKILARCQGLPLAAKALGGLLHTASKIGDLMNLESLKGTLCISHLENVLDVEDERRANLLGKKNLNVLVMKWESELDQRASLDILDMLQPSTTVKEISIDGYVGAKFPTWFGRPSFSNMVLLRIERCRKCTSLPAIGQLPLLRDLVLVGLSAVQTVGLEFYGKDCPKPFPSLESLCFEDMQEWKDWIPCKVEYEEFPRLRELSISQCPKLQGKLPHHVPLLEKFSVNGCEQLDVSIPNFPKLHALAIKGCKGVVSRSTDELCFPKSTILSIPYVKSLTEEFMHGLAKVENLTIDNCKELTSLWQDEFKSLITLDIRGCSSLVNISLTSTLRTLNIEGCSGLKSLSISNCTCLEKASIERCNSLTLISRGQLPQNLKTLNISDCENLQLLADEGEASSNSSSLLEDLVIKRCPSLKCLSSSGDLPTTLKRLLIWSCIELTSLSSKNELPTALKYLSVWDCPKMESIANNLPNNASLEYLHIERCAELKSLPVGLHKLCHLNKIEIWDCPSFVSFPDGGLFPTSLRALSIHGCEKLEAWPNCMPNLNSLEIVKCLSIIYFPEEGYPTSLTSLLFSGENICKQVTVWGLHRLTSLTSLCIYDGIPDWQSFPDEQDGKLTMMLPSSLTRLTIWSIPNIVILSSLGFQNLSALEQLYIGYCPKLASLPEKGLPPSLLHLYINGCPLLKQHYKKGGREWSKIANVPMVWIDGRLSLKTYIMPSADEGEGQQ
ncbi:hypothetical protein CMV_026870 [Castanea mollissima]|uniref:Disease resistance RPP13-like protein 1 n=1 Tax=Castanea mollissima TaxID=60419 RepID=A0A8J4VEB6_9ROSI|nr:hypothetical protein CMV_026870 [Castanea mollissima]